MAVLGDLAGASAHAWLRSPDEKDHYPTAPFLSLPPRCGRSLIILSWLIILWAHTRMWCIARCHRTGKIFILLGFALSFCCQGKVDVLCKGAPRKHCMTVYNKTFYVLKWNMILIDTVTRSPAIGQNDRGLLLLLPETQSCKHIPFCKRQKYNSSIYQKVTSQLKMHLIQLLIKVW